VVLVEDVAVGVHQGQAGVGERSPAAVEAVHVEVIGRAVGQEHRDDIGITTDSPQGDVGMEDVVLCQECVRADAGGGDVAGGGAGGVVGDVGVEGAVDHGQRVVAAGAAARNLLRRQRIDPGDVSGIDDVGVVALGAVVVVGGQAAARAGERQERVRDVGSAGG